MHQRCVAALEDAALKLGRKMTRSEMARFSSGVEKGVTDMYRALAKDNPAQWRTMSKEERATAVGAKLTTHLKAESAKQAQRERKNLVSIAKGYSMLNEAKADGRGGIRHLKHRLAFIADGKGNVVDAEYRARAVEAEYMEMLRPLLDLEKQGSVLGLFYNKEGTNQVVMELKGKATGNPDAKIAAQHAREFLTSIAKDFNDKGGNIAIIDDYIMQKQAPHRVFKATQKTWVDDALRNVNREKLVDLNGNQLDDAKARAFLEEAWYNLAYDGEFKKSGEGVASLANRHKGHRQLEWKSPEAWIEMNDKYGAAPLMDQLQAYAQTMSREIVLMEQFGPNALHNIETLIDYAKSLDRTADQKAGKQLVKDIADLEGMVSHFSGLDQGIKSHFWHKFFKTVKDINVANKLGSVITSQLADNGTAISTVRALNMNLGDWLTHKAKNYTNEQLKSFSRSNGLAFDMIVNDLVRFSDGANPYDITGKLAQTTMKISGASMMTEIHRRSVATFILDQLGQLSRKHDWDTLDVDSKNILVGKGWTKLDWDIVRAAEADTSYGGQGVGMDQIKSIDPEKIRALMPNEMKAIEQGAADIQAMMGAQNQKDSGWLQNRQTKFAEYKDKIQKMIDDYEATRSKNVDKTGDEIGARLDVLKAMRDEADARVAALTGDVSQGVELGARVQKAVDGIREAKMRLSRIERKADKEVFAKATELEKRIDKRMAELEEFTSRLDERIEKRNEISKAHHEAIGKLQQEAIENARKDAYLKITAYALQEAEMAVLQPSLSTHVGPLQLNKGGFLSELGGAILQFKTFPMAMWMKHIQQRANMTPNPMAYRASLLASTAFFGGIGLIMGDLATGKDPREIYSEKDGINLRFGLDAILKGGGLGFFGDMLQAFSDENSRGVEKISGPFLGQVSRTLALGKELLKEAQGKDGNVAKALINLGRELLPFNNLIWTRAVWNNVIASEMNEWASPGYMARARELAHKNYDSSYWIGMNQETRSPNFGNIVGQ